MVARPKPEIKKIGWREILASMGLFSAKRPKDMEAIRKMLRGRFGRDKEK